jgi:hypothetical protein
MKIRLILALLTIGLITRSQIPMKPDLQNSASSRWLKKNVLESRILDNMESLDNWVPFTNGAIAVVDARATAKIEESKSMVTEMSLSNKESHSGEKSILMRLPTKLDCPGPKSGRGWGTAGVYRLFDNEDWSKFNRISIWIRPDCPGYYENWLEMRLFNQGNDKLPGLFAQEGENTVLLKNNEWNHVVWEIGNVSRDKITKLEISSWMPGNEPEATDTVAYYFDDLDLEKVEPDYIEGWKVWPGRISFSHTGYQSGASKSAIANDLKVSDFIVVDNLSGKTVLSKPIKTVTSHLGSFQLLDFSEIQQSGSYHIEAGETVTRQFRIDQDIWEQTIWKALNFFYSERCGTPVPGVHGTCHRDWTCVHGDKTIVINGGWHDAGDFTQGLGNTGEAVYAMFSLAEQIHKNNGNPELYERILAEAQWGLDWILKTSFGDGYRTEGSISSRRTNGIIGDYDDVTTTAKNSPKTNMLASAAEAIAYRVLKERDSRLASYSLKMAEADWQFAIEKMNLNEEPSNKDVFSGSFDSGSVLHEIASLGILASVELWNATGKLCYENKAAELANMIIESQQRKKPDWDVPLTGFFYTSPAKTDILHYCHRGREQAPIVALTKLCESFPDHPDWMKWYSAVTLHSQYLKTIAHYTEPYSVLPASIYTDTEYLQVPESRKESFRKQVLNGIPLGKGHYLRLFPVWMDYRGHFGTILPQAQTLISSARLRGDAECLTLAQHQMEWVVGRNPFSQSTMYGEGYDFTPLYTPSSGDIVGALPVGIQTRAENDIPYWPVQSTWTYKEVWVHPVTQWLWLMCGFEGTPLLNGTASEAGVNKGLFIEASKLSSANGNVTITAKIQGVGEHKLAVRSNNLAVVAPTKLFKLKQGETKVVKWQAKINSNDEPWVVVIVPDDILSNKKELTGSAWEK